MHFILTIVWTSLEYSTLCRGTIAAFQDDEYAVAEGHSEFKFEAEVSAEATVQEGAAEAVKQEVEEVIVSF